MPDTASTADTNHSKTVRANRLASFGLLAAVTACAANGLLFVLARHVLGVPGGFPLSWGPVLASSAVPAVVATVVYGAISRVSRRPNRTFVAVATVVLALSFVPLASPPPELAGAPPSVYVTLVVMHLAAAAAIVGVLTRVSGRGDSTGDSP